MHKLTYWLKLEWIHPKWQLPTAIALGVFVAIGILIFRASEATSYLTDDPKACINCHIMRPEFATYARSSHARVATCNDCHVPQHPLWKWPFKARDGMRHAFMFTFRLEPQVIHASEMAEAAIESNCIRCHGKLIETAGNIKMNQHCFFCHREVPHGRTHSLASSPNAIVPQLDPILK
ncbi:MAG: cytochrome c nitrite reductase small subunit [bacterium]|nr:cytochrome c nitrite reductase small subunit [bacterium]